MNFFTIIEGLSTIILFFYIVILIVDVIYDGVTSRRKR